MCRSSSTAYILRNSRADNTKKVNMSLVQCLPLLVAALLAPALALRCHVCSSDEISGCADPFDPSSVWQDACKPETKDYTNTPFFMNETLKRRPVCKKVLQHEHGKLIYIRSCGMETGRGEACGTVENDMVSYCGICNEDYCNSAPVHAVSMLSIVLAVLLYLGCPWSSFSSCQPSSPL